MSREKTIYNQTYDESQELEVPMVLLKSYYDFMMALSLEEVKEDVVLASKKVYAKTDDEGRVMMYKTGVPVDYTEEPEMDRVEVTMGLDNPIDILNLKDNKTLFISPDGIQYLVLALDINKFKSDGDFAKIPAILFMYMMHTISNVTHKEQHVGLEFVDGDLEKLLENIQEIQEKLQDNLNLLTFYNEKGMMAMSLYYDLTNIHYENIEKGLTKNIDLNVN